MEAEKGISRPDRIFSSLGVPLKGLIKTRFDLNLLPFEMRKKVRQIGKPLLVILTSLAVILSVTWGIGVLTHYSSELNAVNAEIKKRRPEVEIVDKLQKRQEEFRKEIEELEKIKAEEVSKNEMLKELTQVLPATVWIWNFKYNGKEVEVSGFADSASDLIPLIDKSPIFEKVEFSGPVTIERMVRGTETKEKQRFKIKTRLEARRAGP
jgi:general secretion pathway protein L